MSTRFQRGVYPAEDFTAYVFKSYFQLHGLICYIRVKKYGLNMLVTSDDQVKAYIKKIMSQLNKWMTGGKISKLVVVITSKETGEHVERWQFDVQIFNRPSKKVASKDTSKPPDKENAAPMQATLCVPIMPSLFLTSNIETTPNRPQRRQRRRFSLKSSPFSAKSQPP